MIATLLLLVTPALAGAASGWLAIHVATLLVFWPRRPWTLGPLKLQGLLPGTRDAMAQRLGTLAEETLLAPGEIGAMLRDPAMSGVVREALDASMDKLIRESLPRAIPMVAVFLSPEMCGRIKGLLVPEIERLLPGLLDHAAGSVENRLDIAAHVRRKLQDIPDQELEQRLRPLLESHAAGVKLAAGALGAGLGILFGLASLLTAA